MIKLTLAEQHLYLIATNRCPPNFVVRAISNNIYLHFIHSNNHELVEFEEDAEGQICMPQIC